VSSGLCRAPALPCNAVTYFNSKINGRRPTLRGPATLYDDFNAISPAAADRADHEIERSTNELFLSKTTLLCLFNFEPTTAALMLYFYRFLLFIAVVVVVLSACVGLVKVMG
jgi:hypothetical protein